MQHMKHAKIQQEYNNRRRKAVDTNTVIIHHNYVSKINVHIFILFANNYVE